METNPKLAFVNAFLNSAGCIVRAPFDERIPLEMMNSCACEEAGGRTTVTLRSRPINASQEDLDMFRSMLDWMQHGYGGTFEQLDSYLAKSRSCARSGAARAMLPGRLRNLPFIMRLNRLRRRYRSAPQPSP